MHGGRCLLLRENISKEEMPNAMKRFWPFKNQVSLTKTLFKSISWSPKTAYNIVRLVDK